MTCKPVLYIFVVAILALVGCADEPRLAVQTETDPLTDSLVSLLGEMRTAADTASSEQFTTYLDPVERDRLGLLEPRNR